jgi:hypothetical protein
MRARFVSLLLFVGPLIAAAQTDDESEWVNAPPPPLPPAQPDDEVDVADPASAGPPATEPDLADLQAAVEGAGMWVNDADLGRVWLPSPQVVGEDFVPYVTGGIWVYAPVGWTFRSRWPWGWAVFHYGRWCDTPTYGWVWWPGTSWAPAWVEWRQASGYVGWAALAPPGVRHSFGLGSPGWGFAPVGHFGRRDLPRHLVVPQRSGGRWTWIPGVRRSAPARPLPATHPLTPGAHVGGTRRK